jgi:type III secretory pathway lipoprotein EscJ
MNVPYRHADGGQAILVPASQVHDVRLRLASAGLPKGAVGGFELMDKSPFGQTQFQERLNFQRGLQGELERSISSLAAVQAARVHLALPNQNGFFREQQRPSASVLLTLHPGRTLERAQVAGIVHLVSSSVPELNPKAVSVLDGSGALLSGADDSGKGLDAQQLQYVQQIEADVGRRAGALYLANTFGNVAGSLLVGFVLLPRLGVQASVWLLALCAALALLPLRWSAGEQQLSLRGLRVPVFVTCMALIAASATTVFRSSMRSSGQPCILASAAEQAMAMRSYPSSLGRLNSTL